MSSSRPPSVPGYEGVRCLVLGADGFIGRWVVRALVTAGADVHASARDETAAAHVLRRYEIDARILETDLCPPGAARRLVESVRPDVVFNLAGYGVRPTERDPAIAQRMNVGLVEEICGAITADGGESSLVHVGSAAEYGDVGGRLDEDGDARPRGLYGRTKLDGTLAALRAARDHGTRVVVARLFTVYGSGEPEHRLLPSLLAASRSGTSVDLSAGLQKRDFTYVEDVAEGLLRLGRAGGASGSVVNLCTGTLLAVRDFVRAAAGELGIAEDALRFGVLEGGLHDLEHDPVNIDRLVALVGWRPTVGTADGVRRTRDIWERVERDA